MRHRPHRSVLSAQGAPRSLPLAAPRRAAPRRAFVAHPVAHPSPPSVPAARSPQTSTRQHVQRYAESTLGMTGQARRPPQAALLQGRGCVRLTPARSQVLAQLRYDLPASYAFHRAATKDVEVDLWRFTRATSGSTAQ